MKPEISNPTMKDVAREAGVALGTVSKVVNGIPVGDSSSAKPALRTAALPADSICLLYTSDAADD